MYGRDALRLKKALYGNEPKEPQVKMDDIEVDAVDYDAISDSLVLGSTLATILDAIVTSEEGASFDEVLDSIIPDDLDESEVEYLLDAVEKTLIYLKVPPTMLDNLTSDDKDISAIEMDTLREHALECIGENTIFDFVAYALYNPELPDLDEVQLDEIQMDWSFYTSGAKCAAAKKESSGFKKKCIKGYKGGVNGFWLYPKDFKNKKTLGVSAENHESKEKNKKFKPKSEERIWKGKSKTAWLKSMKKHGRIKRKKANAKSVGV